MKKTKKKLNKKLLFSAVLLSIACVILSLAEIYNSRKSYIEQYEKNTELYLDSLLLNGQYRAKEQNTGLAEGIIQVIETEFPTSARMFCLVGMENEILFLRDQVGTAELYDVTVADYIGAGEPGNIRSGKINSTVSRVQKKDRYVITRMDKETEQGILTVAVCTQESYLLKSGNFDMLLQHLSVYIGLLAIAFVVFVAYLSMKVREQIQREASLAEQLTNDRVLIEKMSRHLERHEKGDVMGGEGSYYPRSVVERVLANLTREQRRNSRKAMIYCEKNSQLMMVRMAVLIERILNGRGIFCLWAEDEYQIVVLNAENETVENIVKQVLVQYRDMYQADIDGIRITIDRL